MDPLQILVGYQQNAVHMALKQLVECLVNNGSLREGQFEQALRNTIEHEDAESGRPDYLILSDLLALLEGELPKAH